MYVNPFYAGVVVTLCTEISIIFIVSCVAAFKRGKKNGN